MTLPHHTPPDASAGAIRGVADAVAAKPLQELTRQALALRKQNYYAAHPVETALRALGATGVAAGAQGDGGLAFEAAEAQHRTGAQGLPLSKIPQLPQSIVQLSRLSEVDHAGRTQVRRWAEAQGPQLDEERFERAWQAQNRLGGAEHHVYHDETDGRWFKRLYHGVNHATLCDYLLRMRLHAALFPETAYRLEGFVINPRSKETRPVVSQPHVEVDTQSPPVRKEETDALMAAMGFAPVKLKHNGVEDDGYFAYLHPVLGILVHDLHDENVVRVAGTGELAVIDPYIALARRGSWAALKLAEIGLPAPEDETSP